MEKYVELLKKINSYIESDKAPEVKNGQISLNDLYKIIDNTIDELYKRKEASELMEKLKKGKCSCLHKSFFHKNDGKRISGKYKDYLFYYDEKEISFIIFLQGTGEYRYSIDNESDEIYYGNPNPTPEQRLILEENYDEILSILLGLREYRNITGIMDTYKTSITQMFSDGFIDVNFTYDYQARLRTDIQVDKKADPDNVSKREYARREKLQNIITENAESFMKKVVINISDLNKGCKKMLKRKNIV